MTMVLRNSSRGGVNQHARNPQRLPAMSDAPASAGLEITSKHAQHGHRSLAAGCRGIGPRETHSCLVGVPGFHGCLNSPARRQAAKATDFDSVTRGFESRRARHSVCGAIDGQTRCWPALLLLQAVNGPDGSQLTTRRNQGSLHPQARRRQTDRDLLPLLQQSQERREHSDMAGVHGQHTELVAAPSNTRLRTLPADVASPLNFLCNPECRSADYCWYFGCPFEGGE